MHIGGALEVGMGKRPPVGGMDIGDAHVARLMCKNKVGYEQMKIGTPTIERVSRAVPRQRRSVRALSGCSQRGVLWNGALNQQRRSKRAFLTLNDRQLC